ncbi:MAG: ketol-acid reductoisomerase, partial [Gammaproteobacteria bacterium]|nr:ketol-acid reductoisomerase [Gammaproteobacteria bacterium]
MHSGAKNLEALRKKGREHQIEEVGASLRSMMPWIKANKIVDKSKN